MAKTDSTGEQKVGYIGIDIGTRFLKIASSTEIKKRDEEIMDPSLSQEEQKKQIEESHAHPNRFYTLSKGLLLKDHEMIARERNRDFFVGYDLGGNSTTVEQDESGRLGTCGHFLKEGAVFNEELLERFMLDLFNKRLPKDMRFYIGYANAPAEHAAQEESKDRAGELTAHTMALKRIFEKLEDRVIDNVTIGQLSAAVYNIESDNGKERKAYAMGIDMGGGQTIVQAVPKGKVEDMGLYRLIKGFAGSDVAQMLLKELQEREPTYKVSSKKPIWSEADVERILRHGYGTVDENQAEELKKWAQGPRFGGIKMNRDISSTVVNVCRRMVLPIVENIQQLCLDVQEKYAGESFGGYEMDQMLSRIYVSGQNSNIRGLMPAISKELEKRNMLGCNFIELPDKRFGVALGAQKFAEYLTKENLWDKVEKLS